MDQKTQKRIIEICKEMGCCDACCLRYIGLKNPSAYETPLEVIGKILDSNSNNQTNESENSTSESLQRSESEDFIPKKKSKMCDVCVSCVGVLQEEAWEECRTLLRAMLDDKRYECESFACALSAPIATILREKAVTLHIAEEIPHYDDNAVTSLKEAWKWSRGAGLAREARMALEGGGAAPLLLTVTLRYDADRAELEAVRRLAPAQCGRRGGAVTRRACGAALDGASAAALRAAGGAVPPAAPSARARAAAAAGERRALLLAGRYVKLARDLPQTPWLVAGRRALPSSVQDLIFAPLAALYGFDEAEAERRLKFMSAGREDVDVRCLGDGRPFAVEVTDPRRDPTPEELERICAEISRSERVTVESLVPITRERLGELKRGEETKCKTYEALCVKLAHTAEDVAEGATAATRVRVTARDLDNVARWSGTVRQRTPLRVLHRRPLLARARRVLRLRAARVPGHPALLALRVRTDAGTYVKEWAHGELRRSAPALAHALRARADILALDVTAVHLAWP